MNRRSPAANLLILTTCLVACFGAAGLGAYWTAPSIPTWYASLRKPSWNPPNWVFGPVWTALYLMMAVAASIVWNRAGLGRDTGGRRALALFGVQLALNVAWSGVFFGLQRPGWAFAEIVLLWSAIVATIAAFARISRSAAILLVPYLLWVSFAGVLNFAVWRLNT